MKNLLGGALVAALLLSACSPSGDHSESDATPMLWAAGAERPLERGQWQLVNYWAVWCKPCVKEIPELNALAAAEPMLQVVGVNYDRPPLTQLLKQADTLGIQFPLLIAHPEGLGIATPRVLPTSYIVSPTGQTVAVLTGPQTHDSLRAALTKAGF